MLKLSKKLVIVSLLLVVMLAFVLPMSVQADEGIQIINPGAATPTPTVTSSPSVATTKTPTPTAKATATTSTALPQTGIEDYTGLIVGAVLIGLTSVIAYVKIKKSDV